MDDKPTVETARGQPDSGLVDLIIKPQEHDLGAFSVRRSLPAAERQMVGPFILFDHFGPATLPKDQPINIRPHPHIGLATLTWLFEGSIMHRDSLGSAQEIHPGEVNWMTAGSGIVHSERTPERLLGQEQRVFGLQIWMALPRAHEETAPSFQHYTANELPVIEGDGVKATIVAGRAWGQASPVAVYSDTLYVNMTLRAGAKTEIAAEHEERAVYLLSGCIDIDGTRFGPRGMVVLTPGVATTIDAVEETHLVLSGGEKMDGPRIKWWNLVSSRQDRIDQAKADWSAGRFPKVPGDEVEFIPLPDD